MAYDIFSQISSPATPISLYGDAAKAGAAVGTAIPNDFTAFTQGVFEGIDKSQRIRSNEATIEAQQQANVIRQNQIDRLGVANDIQDTQLQAAKTQEEIKALQLEIDRQTAQDSLEAEKSRLQNIKSQNDAKKQLQQRTDTFNNQWQNSDQVTKRDMLLSGQWNDVLSNDPNLFRQSIGTVNRELSDSQRRDLSIAAGTAQANKNYYANLEKYQIKAAKAEEDFAADQWAKDASNIAGKPIQVIADQIQEVPSDLYKYDPITKKIEFNADGSMVRNEIGKAGTERDWILNGKVVASKVPASSQKLRTDYIHALRDVHGINRDSEIEDLKETYSSVMGDMQGEAQSEDRFKQQVESLAPVPVAPAKGAAYKVVPNPSATQDIDTTTVVNTRNNINISNNPAVYALTQQTLGLNDQDFTKVKPDIKRMLSVVETGPEGWRGNYTSDQVKELDSSQVSIAQFTAGREFDTNPELQAKYTDEQVAAHNASVDKYLAASGANAFLGIFVPNSIADLESMTSLTGASQLTKVKTPRELYIIGRMNYYSTLFQNYLDKLDKRRRKDETSIARTNLRGADIMRKLNVGP